MSLGTHRATPFEREFSSEDLLRQAIAGLLRRMNHISGVQVTHGRDERGKDIVFFLDGLGERIPCACVVKNAAVTGSVSDSDGARNVYFQVEQCLDSYFTDERGTRIRIERVYVVTPYEMSLAAIDSITGKVRAQPGRVQFMHGTPLFRLFRQYWPDYLAEEADFLRGYLKRTREELEYDRDLDGIARRYSIDTPNSNIKSVYVRPNLHYDLTVVGVSPSLQAYLPSEERLARSWTRSEIVDVRSQSEQLAASVDTIKTAWGRLSGARVYISSKRIETFRINPQPGMVDCCAKSGKRSPKHHNKPASRRFGVHRLASKPRRGVLDELSHSSGLNI